MQGLVWFRQPPGMEGYDEARAGWRADEGTGFGLGIWSERDDAHKLELPTIAAGTNGERIARAADSDANAPIHPFGYRGERPV